MILYSYANSSTSDSNESDNERKRNIEIYTNCFRFSLLLWIVPSYYLLTLCYEKNVKYYSIFCFASQILYAFKSILINAKISHFSTFKTNVICCLFLLPITNLMILVEQFNTNDEFILPSIIFVVNLFYTGFGYLVTKQLNDFKKFNNTSVKPKSSTSIPFFAINNKKVLYVVTKKGTVFYIFADGFFSYIRCPQLFAEFGILISFSLYITNPIFCTLYIILSTIFITHTIHLKEKRFAEKIGKENFDLYKSIVEFSCF